VELQPHYLAVLIKKICRDILKHNMGISVLTLNLPTSVVWHTWRCSV